MAVGSPGNIAASPWVREAWFHETPRIYLHAACDDAGCGCHRLTGA